jgi:D-alanine-D-alanine ligase
VGCVRVVVAYNDDAHLKKHLNEVELLGEAEVIDTAREVAELTGGTPLPVRDVRDALETLRRERPDVVFNLCEGVAGNPRWEMNFALALEMIGIPFTGCDPIATAICNDKKLTKQLLEVTGCPVPGLGNGPWIVKPAREDAGIGIDAASVCRTNDEVAARVRHVETTYGQPALVEEFIDGRELNQAVFFDRSHAPVILPPGEIVFSDELAPAERVVGWRAKWDSGSAEDRSTVSRTPGVIDDTTRSDLAAMCLRAATVLSLRGYCRFDVRQRPTGELCVIDVNPNPDIGRESGFRKALAAAGIEFPDFLNELMMAALARRL